MLHLFSVLGSLLPVALAQGPCVGLNCGIGANPLPHFIEVAAAVLVEIVSGLSVLFVVLGGAMLVMNMGNESMADKGKKSIMLSLVGYAIALSSQTIIAFTVGRATLVNRDVPHLSIMRVLVNSMLYTFNAVFALMMIYFGYKLVLGRGDQGELDSVKKGLGWSVMGALGVNLGYALVRATSGLGF